jgi:hypothetical protein
MVHFDCTIIHHHYVETQMKNKSYTANTTVGSSVSGFGFDCSTFVINLNG